MQVNRYKPAAEIEGIDMMKIGAIAAVVVVGLLVVAIITFVIVPNFTAAPDDVAMAYAVKIDSPMFVDVDGDGDIDLLLPGGYIVYNSPQSLPPTK